MIKIRKNNLPTDLITSLKDFKEFFEFLKVAFWLGGGLLQKIYEKDYKSIKKSWEDSEHDIDFFTIQENKNIIESSSFLKEKGYEKIGHFPYKTAYQKNGKSFEIIYFYYSEWNEHIIYYLGYGKKEPWSIVTQNLKDPRRYRLYRYDFPEEILKKEELKINGIKIPALNKLYIQLSYPKLNNP